MCGDGAHMAKDVHKQLLEILESGMDSDGAGAFLKQMMKSGRYVRDVWS